MRLLNLYSQNTMTTLLIVLAVVLVPVIYNWLFPLKPPVLEGYFTPGMTFTSEAEGVTQKVLKQENGLVLTEVVFAPHAVGPPEHLHIGFDESGTVKKGILTIKIDDQPRQLQEGESLILPKGHYHSLYNETDEIVVAEGVIPEHFMYCLAQMYPLFKDNSPLTMVHLFYKIALLGDMADTYIKGAPVAGMKFIKTVLKPYARALGYRLYDDKSKPG
jgi:quercetin dioxygenase-like cupin family protein